MEAAIGFFFVMLTFLLIILLAAYCYRHRAAITKWMNPTYYAYNDRKLQLRRQIENAEKELEAIEKAEAETGA